LRQRYLKMPPSIALGWLKFGVGVALIVLIGAVFLPRPGAREAWTALHYQIDYQLRRASQYAAPVNPPGQGQGRPGDEAGGKQGSAQEPDQRTGNKKTAGRKKSGETKNPPQTNPSPSPTPTSPASQPGSIYNFLRIAFWIIATLVIGGWIIRRRHLLLEMARSIISALKEFLRKFFVLTPLRKPVKKTGPIPVLAKFNSFAEYKNPFFAAKDHAWPPEQIIIYSYEAVQVWAKERGLAARPEETAREFCGRLGEQRPELDSPLEQLARLYAHAAYGTKLPPNSDLEPIRELWRLLPIAAVQTVVLARR